MDRAVVANEQRKGKKQNRKEKKKKERKKLPEVLLTDEFYLGSLYTDIVCEAE